MEAGENDSVYRKRNEETEHLKKLSLSQLFSLSNAVLNDTVTPPPLPRLSLITQTHTHLSLSGASLSPSQTLGGASEPRGAGQTCRGVSVC